MKKVLKKKKYSQALLSSRLGDGCFIKNGEYCFQFVCKFEDYLDYKLSCLKKIGIPFREDPKSITLSGYKEGSYSHNFISRNSTKLTEVACLTKKSVIQHLDKEGLIMYFLEDGSYHQRKHFMHLYCNSFTDEEVDALIEKLYEIYPIKRAVKRADRKKDGRSFPYLYIPVSVANIFRQDILDFLLRNNISSLLYKAGVSPSTTIETDYSESH